MNLEMNKVLYFSTQYELEYRISILVDRVKFQKLLIVVI
jgi:hypothetical protein